MAISYGGNLNSVATSTQMTLVNNYIDFTASGTAALECAVMDTPEVVCYKLSFVSAFIAKRLNKAPFISMVNLIVNRKVGSYIISLHILQRFLFIIHVQLFMIFR